MYKLKYGAPDLYPEYAEDNIYEIMPENQKIWYYKIIYVYLWAGWRKYGIQTAEAKSLSHNGKVAYNDYKTQSGSIIPNEIRYTNFCLTYKDAIKKALAEIKKEINAKKRAINRLTQIKQKLTKENRCQKVIG